MSDLLESLSSLPPPFQTAALIGVAIGGAAIIIWKVWGLFKMPTAPAAVSPEITLLATETMKLATQLADEKLRNDLMDVVNAARTALEIRIEKLGDETRAAFLRVEQDGSHKRHEIYRRFEEMERRINEAMTMISAIRPRRGTT